MVDESNEPVTLCCLLWARPGQRDALATYEDRVLAFVPEHDGTVLQRAITNGADDASGHPDEVQLFYFASQRGLDGYLNDPRRLALTAERDRVVERTELFPIRMA